MRAALHLRVRVLVTWSLGAGKFYFRLKTRIVTSHARNLRQISKSLHHGITRSRKICD
jgi:hypothetical protein